MDCNRIADDQIMERYLLHELDDAEREAFEQHFFECDECFSQLEALQAAKGALAAEPTTRPPQIRFGARKWTVAAAAVVVFGLAAVIAWFLQPTGPETATLSPALANLARIEAPHYQPIRLRGAEDEAQQRFRTAMEFYSTGDYLSAIPGLEEAANLDPAAPNISFYLGACYLLSDRPSESIATLQRTIDLGDTPFLEEALMLIAKTLLASGDVDAAEGRLLEVVELEGDLADEGRGILEDLANQ